MYTPLATYVIKAHQTALEAEVEQIRLVKDARSSESRIGAAVASIVDAIIGILAPRTTSLAQA